MNRRCFFLDEPTVGVDPQSRNFIFEGVEALKRAGLTVIYTTHYMEEAERLCDRLAIIDRGALIALDSPQAMIKAHGGSIVIELDQDAAEAAAAVKTVAEVTNVICEGSRVTIAASSPARILGRVIERIMGTGREIRSIEIVNANLESVFLDLTGRRLRE
jgi:ABC-2 type transport system ATP-binding protein